jgi:hypothetical protein
MRAFAVSSFVVQEPLPERFEKLRSVNYRNAIEAISPGFARHELPWENEQKSGYPEGVGSEREQYRVTSKRRT